MDVRVLEVELCVIVVRIVSVLVRQHPYILAYCAVALVLDNHGAACEARLVVVVCVFERNVLNVGVVACYEECSRNADAFLFCFVYNESVVHALADERYVVAGNRCKHFVSEVISAVRHKDIGALVG